MLAIERKRKIMNLLQESNSVMVPELSKYFNVTEETIRRDLEKLEKEGLLKRTYGGAVINDSINSDIPLNIRETSNIEAKRSIGAKVAEFIEDGDTIMLDSSSTAFQVAKKIKNKKKITVITNSLKILQELIDAPDCRLISTGGILRQQSVSLVGNSAERNISDYNVDKVVISCKGVHMEKGITESNEMEAEIKKAMINSSEQKYLAVDNSKIDKASFVRMLRFEQINVIFTNKKLSPEWEELISSYNIKLVYCQ